MRNSYKPPVGPSMDRLRLFHVERWIGVRLKADIFSGNTDEALRRERVRYAIVQRNSQASSAGIGPAGISETYAELFARIYGEPLENRHDESKIETASAEVSSVGSGAIEPA